MTDPLDALRRPVVPVDPDPAFAASLRERLRRALLQPHEPTEPTGVTMTSPSAVPSAVSDPAALAWPPALAPYLIVSDARRALDWYVEVFQAERRGEPYLMPDGRIGHAELGIGDAVLMLAEESPENDLLSPRARGGVSHTVWAAVADVDATVARAVAAGAELTRPVADQPYGRSGVIVDPFGHRWLVTTPPARATRVRHGEVGYVTLRLPDDTRAREFFQAVLGWRFTPGSVPRGWQIENTAPMAGLAGGADRPQVRLCYRVADLDAALTRVRDHGGRAGEPQVAPYGRIAECVDDQGLEFELWEPPRV